MANSNLTNARRAKNDEFYTQFHDIEKEIAAYIEYNPDIFQDKIILLPCDDPEWSNFTKFFAQNFERLAMLELLKTKPFGAVWDYYCLKQEVLISEDYISEIQDYENTVLKKR